MAYCVAKMNTTGAVGSEPYRKEKEARLLADVSFNEVKCCKHCHVISRVTNGRSNLQQNKHMWCDLNTKLPIEQLKKSVYIFEAINKRDVIKVGAVIRLILPTIL